MNSKVLFVILVGIVWFKAASSWWMNSPTVGTMASRHHWGGCCQTTKSFSKLYDVNSKTHMKQLARIKRKKEKAKETNRLKTHFDKDYSALKRTKSLPRTKPLTKREIQFRRVLPQLNFVRNTTIDSSAVSFVPLSSDELMPQINCILTAAAERKATAMAAIRVQHLSNAAKFIVVIEGSNKPQLQAMMDGIKVIDHSTYSLTTLMFLSC
jgi:hypothetical protein